MISVYSNPLAPAGSPADKTCFPVKLMEFGFLWSIFFIPWGPLLRYFGWLIFLIGFIFRALAQKKLPESCLMKEVKILLLLMLIWGAFTTMTSGVSLYWYLKGFSFLMEMCFGIWVVSVVLAVSSGTLKRFFIVLAASVVTAGFWTIGRFFLFSSMSGPFSNINTLGLFTVTALPLCMSLLLVEEEGRKISGISIFASAAALIMVVISFSTSAWITGLIIFTIFGVISLARYKKGFLLLIGTAGLVIVLIASVFFLAPPDRRANLIRNCNREIRQINLFSGKSSMEGFTNNRFDIWKGTWLMIKEKPFIGWGWGQFRKNFMEFNEKWWDLDLKPLEAHNLYLEMLLNGGILNLAFFLLLMYMATKNSWKLYNMTGFPWYLGFIVLFVSQLVFSMAGNIFLSRQIACILWTVIGISTMSNPPEVLEKKQPQS